MLRTVAAYFQNHPWAKYILLGLVTLLMVIGIANLFNQAPASSKNTPIEIGLAAPLTGTGASGGKEMVQSVQLYLDEINAAGGIQGHPLKLVTFDDQGNPDVARAVASKIVASPALVLLGHRSSDASIAAGEIYEAHRLPAITGTANNEKVTENRPYYFRMIYTNSDLAGVLSLYAQKVLQFPAASIIGDQASGNSRFISQALAENFGAAGTIKYRGMVDSSPNHKAASIQTVVQELATIPDPGLVFLPISNEDLAREIIVAIRQKGIPVEIVAEQALSRELFAASFKDYPEEKNNPGYFTNGLYLPSPLLFDSAGANAQDFAAAYEKAYGEMPSYLGAKFYEAAMMAVAGLEQAELQLNPQAIQADREAIKTALSAINSPKVALAGLTGPLYFNANRSSDQPIRVAEFAHRRLISAPAQFTTVNSPDRLNLPNELQAGNIIQFQDRYFWQQRVVYTGIDFNKLNRIDQGKSSFTADFYVWFRYQGNDEAVKIEFPDAVSNSVNPSAPVFDPQIPLKAKVVDGLNYRLYRVRGEFKNAFDFRDYPFDSQKLTLRFDNPHLSDDRLVYVIDRTGLKLPKPDVIQRKPFQGLQLWTFKDMAYFPDSSRNTSTLGDPDLFQTNLVQDYPGFSVRMTMQRKTLVFLSKNLLPLLLLTLISYCTLYFPHSMFVPRIMAPASTLLSGIVLLLAFNNQLPEVSYTVAIEYVFYTYFFLCLIPVFVTVIAAKLEKAGRKEALRQLDLTARIAFPLIVLSLISIYGLAYGGRLV